MIVRSIISAAILLFASQAASAAGSAHPGAQQLGKFGAWEAATFSDGKGGKVCYMATAPTSTASARPVKGRDKNVLMFITDWPGQKEKNAVTITAGYSYKSGSKTVVTIGGKTYDMTVGGPGTGGDPDMAWMDDNAREDALVADIKAGTSLTVAGTSRRGTVITDTYDLKGSAEAYAAIDKACAGN